MFEKIISAINKAKNILVFIHMNPDGDALGSALGFANGMEKAGKNVAILLEKEKDEMFSCFSGPFVTDADEKEFDLLVSLDCGSLERMGKVADKFYGNTINIDHHHQNTNFADINYVDGEKAATGEIVYLLLKEMNIEFDEKIASPLYGAILTDTGGFMFSNTSEFTHKMAADLISSGADYYELNKKLMGEKSYHRHLLSAKCVEKMEFESDGKICICVLSNEFCCEHNINNDELNGIPALLRSVSGVEVGVLITEAEKGTIKVSLRSDKIVDVSKICEKFGGGGHIRAGGIRIQRRDINEIKEELLKEIKKEL